MPRFPQQKKGHGLPAHDPLGRDHYLPVLGNSAKTTLVLVGLAGKSLGKKCSSWGGALGSWIRLRKSQAGGGCGIPGLEKRENPSTCSGQALRHPASGVNWREAQGLKPSCLLARIGTAAVPFHESLLQTTPFLEVRGWVGHSLSCRV